MSSSEYLEVLRNPEALISGSVALVERTLSLGYLTLRGRNIKGPVFTALWHKGVSCHKGDTGSVAGLHGTRLSPAHCTHTFSSGEGDGRPWAEGPQGFSVRVRVRVCDRVGWLGSCCLPWPPLP